MQSTLNIIIRSMWLWLDHKDVIHENSQKSATDRIENTLVIDKLKSSQLFCDWDLMDHKILAMDQNLYFI